MNWSLQGTSTPQARTEGKVEKKKKGKGMQESGQRAVGNWMVKTWSLYTKQKL